MINCGADVIESEGIEFRAKRVNGSDNELVGGEEKSGFLG